MDRTFQLALYQFNSILGDIGSNLESLRTARRQAAQGGADLLVAPELCLLGYPPEDLVMRASVLESVGCALETLASETADGGPGLLIGAPQPYGRGCSNAAILIDGGKIQAITHKHHLPNYGVFDEKRVFVPGTLPTPLVFRGLRLGVMVCEDMWFSDVAARLCQEKADILVVLNGSPYDQACDGQTDKMTERLAHAGSRVRETGLPLVYVNQVGGQDEVVFDGGSFVLAPDSPDPVVQAPRWRQQVFFTTWRAKKAPGDITRLVCEKQTLPAGLSPLGEMYQALVTGLRDYVRKNRFPGVVLGLSGGIDSALALAIAVDALGSDQVLAVMMPSPYTSNESLEDASACADLVGVRLDRINIAPAMTTFETLLAPFFAGRPADLTEENLQSRVRAVLLMALSNKLGPMLLSTGNKSEMSVGYTTLYGDMSGGFAVLKDVYKTRVFDLAHWRNAHREDGWLGPAGPVMPERVILKPPSAELRPDQKDEDSLPPYDQLDAILQSLIEGQQGVRETARRLGFPLDLVGRVWNMLRSAEYKRRQAPPGVKVTRLAFGRERRYPITNSFSG